MNPSFLILKWWPSIVMKHYLRSDNTVSEYTV